MTMHPYLRASLELELALDKGENYHTALSTICRRYLFTAGERELLVDTLRQRRAKGRRIKIVNPQFSTRPK